MGSIVLKISFKEVLSVVLVVTTSPLSTTTVGNVELVLLIFRGGTRSCCWGSAWEAGPGARAGGGGEDTTTTMQVGLLPVDAGDLLAAAVLRPPLDFLGEMAARVLTLAALGLDL